MNKNQKDNNIGIIVEVLKDGWVYVMVGHQQLSLFKDHKILLQQLLQMEKPKYFSGLMTLEL